MPCPGPKEHQSQAHGSKSGTLKRHWMLGKWPEKSIFCMFSNFVHFFATSGPGNLWKLLSTWKCLPVDIFSTIFGDLEQILGLKLPHPTIGMAWKIIFCLFSNFFYFLGSKWPNMVLNISTGRYFHVLSCFHRFLGLLVAKKWKKFEKMQKIDFSSIQMVGYGNFKP